MQCGGFMNEKELMVRQLPPPEDERIFKSMVSKMIGSWCEDNHASDTEIDAMEWLRNKIFETYELRRRQSA
jgi:hypothetical protein